MNMDGTIPVINPMDVVAIEEPGEVTISTGPKDLTDKELEDYAKRTGAEIVVLRALSNRSVMGELVQRLGAAKVGSSMLVDSEKMIKDGITLCDGMISEYAHDSKLVGSIMKVRLGFVDLWVKAASSHIESRKNAGPEGSPEKPQQVPFPPSVPLQINIQNNTLSKPDQT